MEVMPTGSWTQTAIGPYYQVGMKTQIAMYTIIEGSKVVLLIYCFNIFFVSKLKKILV